MRNPLGRSAGGALLQHGVDLLQSETLGLGHEEVCVDEAQTAQTAPDVEDLGSKVSLVGVNHVRSDDGDDAVPYDRENCTVSYCPVHTQNKLREMWDCNLHSQLEAVDMATPLARMGREKTSPITTQAPGPQVVAKKKM